MENIEAQEDNGHPDAIITGSRGEWTEYSGPEPGIEYIKRRSDEFNGTAFALFSNLEPDYLDHRMEQIPGLVSYREKPSMKVVAGSEEFQRWVKHLVYMGEMRRMDSSAEIEVDRMQKLTKEAENYFQAGKDNVSVWHAIV